MLARPSTGLTLTDWTIVVQCERNRVGTILSFDRGLDQVYSRNGASPPGARARGAASRPEDPKASR